jgi:HNH endonuclease/AP2 domain
MNKNISMKIIEGLKLIEQLNKIFCVEIWEQIRDYPEFECSINGNVRNITTHIEAKQWTSPNGYALVRLLRKPSYSDTIDPNDAVLIDYGYDMLVKLHHVIAFTFIENSNDSPCVDHINNDPRDNRVVNLRWCTHQQNSRNRRKTKSETTSKFKGVTYDKQSKVWRVQIKCGKNIYLGCFKTEEEAGRVYNQKALELFGEFAKLNTL